MDIFQLLKIAEDKTARMRQREFPIIIRDLLDTGAEELELTVDRQTAERIAFAIELLTNLEDGFYG